MMFDNVKSNSSMKSSGLFILINEYNHVVGYYVNMPILN